MVTKAPTPEERRTARKVLQYYLKRAMADVDDIDQEQPSTWVEGLGTCIDLMGQDPDKVFVDYAVDYAAGH